MIYITVFGVLMTIVSAGVIIAIYEAGRHMED